jgi:hypothetical protein
LIVAADRNVLDDPEFACHMYYGIQRSSAAVVNKPEASLNSLLEAVPEADPESQRAQLDALVRSDAFGDRPVGPHRWTGWAKEHGVISKGGRVGAGFAPSVDCAAFKAKR